MGSKIVVPSKLDLKYASLWHDSNSGKLPLFLRASWLKPLNKRDKQVFSTAVYMVMDMLADDGLIKQETIRKIHDKENGWAGRSQIKIGRVPAYLYVEVGFVVGVLLAGGLQLIIWIIGKLL